ncbi:hypothetical protein [Mycobacterium sp. DL592]|uniref:hypothetical protein n=1 Tax=Mycobacterium sp. DL592 TaxID=2675524 RepID=UPI00141F1D6B|nr:hypothetical protein [Mycobacterium sp. DL592]
MSVHDPLDQDARTARAATVWALTGAGAVLAAAGLVIGVTVTAGSPDTLPAAQAAPSTTTTTTATTAPSSSGTATTTTTSGPATYKADSKGYVDTKARCDERQTVMAYGRTERSLAVICVSPDGTLEYRGVRLRDNAAIQVSASRGADGTVVANNDGVTYSISPTVFLVSEGDNVLYRDSWLEFQQPGFSGGSTTSATTSGSAAPTVSTTTVTITTSVTAGPKS